MSPFHKQNETQKAPIQGYEASLEAARRALEAAERALSRLSDGSWRRQVRWQRPSNTSARSPSSAISSANCTPPPKSQGSRSRGALGRRSRTAARRR